MAMNSPYLALGDNERRRLVRMTYQAASRAEAEFRALRALNPAPTEQLGAARRRWELLHRRAADIVNSVGYAST